MRRPPGAPARVEAQQSEVPALEGAGFARLDSQDVPRAGAERLSTSAPVFTSRRIDKALKARRTRGLAVAGVAAVCLVGLGLRIWVLGRWPVTSDEAVVGLMASHILHGHFSAFYWGQTYGGVEPYATALVFAVLGQSSFTLGLTPVLLNAVTAILVWRLGRRLFSPAVGVGAALLYWVWPLADVLRSTYTDGIRAAALLLGILVLLFGQRIADRGRLAGRKARSPRVLADWGVLGLAIGLGWWATPEIGYFVIPVAVVFTILLIRRRLPLTVPASGIFLVSLVVGALPWVWANARSHLGSFRAAPHPGNAILDHLHILRVHVLPISLGLQLQSSGEWLVGRTFGEIAEYVIVVAGLIWLVVLAKSGRAYTLIVFVVVFPFLYAYSPFASVWQDGRYAVYFAPVGCLLLVSGLAELGTRLHLPGLVVRDSAGSFVAVLFGLGLTLAGAMQLSPFAPGQVGPLGSNDWTTWHSDPAASYAQMSRQLERMNVRSVVATYWVSYVIDFESHESVVASDLRYVRYQPYLQQIQHARNLAWMFYDPPGSSGPMAAAAGLDPGCVYGVPGCLLPDPFTQWLRSSGISYRSFRSGAFVFVIPERPVQPSAVVQRFGIPAAS